MRAARDHPAGEKRLPRARRGGDDANALRRRGDARRDAGRNLELLIDAGGDVARVFGVASPHPHVFDGTNGGNGRHLRHRLPSRPEDRHLLDVVRREKPRGHARHRAGANLAEGEGLDDCGERAGGAVVDDQQRRRAARGVGPSLRPGESGRDGADGV